VFKPYISPSTSIYIFVFVLMAGYVSVLTFLEHRVGIAVSRGTMNINVKVDRKSS